MPFPLMSLVGFKRFKLSLHIPYICDYVYKISPILITRKNLPKR